MGFLKSLKGKMKGDETGHGHNDLPPAYQWAESDSKNTTANEKSRMFGHVSEPEKGSASQFYAPPSGPPPSHNNYAPPAGPPPSHDDSSNPPPYQDWLAVPDNALLPPPPSMHDDYSPAHNASVQSADEAQAWCERNPVFRPGVPNQVLLDAVHLNGDLRLEAPTGFKGNVQQLSAQGSSVECTSRFLVNTHMAQDDTIFLTNLPLYFAAHDNPLLPQNLQSTQRSKTISFSLQINKLNGPDAIVAIGFASKPYPLSRLPGWHRSSLAVHSDDGRKYVNDPWGGQDFVNPFQQGDIITITMVVHPNISPVQRSTSKYARSVSSLPKCSTKVEFRRNGRLEGGWDVHEERDAEKDEGIEGLQGDSDYYAAVGVSSGVEVEVFFWPQNV